MILIINIWNLKDFMIKTIKVIHHFLIKIMIFVLDGTLYNQKKTLFHFTTLK